MKTARDEVVWRTSGEGSSRWGVTASAHAPRQELIWSVQGLDRRLGWQTKGAKREVVRGGDRERTAVDAGRAFSIDVVKTWTSACMRQRATG